MCKPPRRCKIESTNLEVLIRVTRRKDPERAAKRAKMGALLQELQVNSMQDINDLFKEMVGTFLEHGLEAELDEELGYSKYDYRNKETDNSRNGHSSKICGPVSARSRFLFPVTGGVNLNRSF